MSDSLLLDQIEKIPAADMESFIKMLWDQDMDMGVDRYFYDPVLREQHIKKQEAEQNRLLELKKKYAQQEMLHYTIDEETGERIPNPSAGPFQPPSQFTEETDLSNELAELADLEYYLGDGSAPNADLKQLEQQKYNNNIPSHTQADFSNSMIIQTADQPNPVAEVDMWPTEITMLPGPSHDGLSEMVENTDMFMSQVWGVDQGSDSKSSLNNNYYGANNDAVDMSTGYQTYTEPEPVDRYQSTVGNNYYNGNNSDSGISDTFLDVFDSENGNYAGPAYSEDVKPYYLFSDKQSESSANHPSSSNPSYSGSENGDYAGSLTQSENDREKRSACRDEMRCQELSIPFTVEAITNYPVEEFNALMKQHRLTEEQLTLVKDIRRRGKNKVAAQNCRKKKMNELTGLEEEIHDLKRKRTDLVRDKEELKRSKLHLRKQLDQTYAEVFNSIRDHLGRPYDPRFYTLHISDDGEARVIPNKVSTYALLNYHQAA